MDLSIKLHKPMLLCCAILLQTIIHADAFGSDESQQTKETKPNIIIILADDMVRFG